MASIIKALPTFIFMLFTLLLHFQSGFGELKVKYYSTSCPEAENIIKDEVIKLYNEHGNTAVSWLRNLFHDCMVQSCDASVLLETNAPLGILTEKTDTRNFGMRNFKYVNTIKQALEKKCPLTVSCADIIALSARDGAQMLGGPYIEMKTGRRDSRQSYAAMVEKFIPNHNVSASTLLSSFKSIGIDTEGVVAILGAHSVGRVHCVNLVNRLYPTVDPTLDADYAAYLKLRCPTTNPNPNDVVYARNDRETPMILDNNYYNNILGHKGLLKIDQELVSDERTLPYVKKMAVDNKYFHDQFSRAMIILSENNPLTGSPGEIRKDCRFVNAKV